MYFLLGECLTTFICVHLVLYFGCKTALTSIILGMYIYKISNFLMQPNMKKNPDRIHSNS